MTIGAPPLYEPMVDETGVASPLWTLFFNNLFEGDAGTEWVPTFVSLGQTGTPTFRGRYYRLNQNVCLFYVTITPSTDTTSTAATTYIDNFPLRFQFDGVCFASTGSGAVQGIGGIRASDNRIYTPSWMTFSGPLTVFGFGVAR